jgi:UDP-N-acetylmuramoyl-L-alanyl-D-glutamate--2,6-diaminopimelate ligase
MHPARPLDALLLGIATVPAGITVSDVTLDSRQVRPGALFIACRGRRMHGIERVADAVAAGARAVLWEPEEGLSVPALGAQVHAVAVPGLARLCGTIADRFFDAPSAQLAIAGITGTNGKTTSAWLLAQALEACGRPCGYLGTIGVGRPGSLQSSAYTTADVVTVHRQLAALRAGGASCVAMEVSSHALDQGRIDAVQLRVAAFTNLTRDHLDYHGTMADYGAAKARLFRWPRLTGRVLNVDDPFGVELAVREGAGALWLTHRDPASAALVQRLARGGAHWLRASDVRATPLGLSWQLESDAGRRAVQAPLIGEFNVDNVLTVLGMLLALEVPLDAAVAAIGACAAAPGRMEAIGGGAAMPLAIVDYAHTPDALAKALLAARTHCTGRLRVVFGCGGDRDAGKRPLMGRIAAELADDIVLTDDNPRTEAPSRIVADIAAGLPAGRNAEVVHDRAVAIRATLATARAGDVVLVAGKGHEDYQVLGTTRLPFSDQQVVRAAFAGVAS